MGDGEQQGERVQEGAERRRLLAAARGGDAAAFAALFAPDLDLAWRMALRVTGEPTRADDALQEGLLAAYRHLDRVEPRNLRGWFVRIVQNAARDGERHERRRPTRPLPEVGEHGDDPWSGRPYGGSGEIPAPSAAEPAAVAEQRELAHRLRGALAMIREERRTAILLVDIDGYDYAEVAAITGVSIGTVKSRISRGRAELRELLGDLAGNRDAGRGVEEGR
jgi:RNA polymerase sigma-70 factor (ECF subfamily)